jgi:hypothetical protein
MTKKCRDRITKERPLSGKWAPAAIARVILVAVLIGSPFGAAGGFGSDARTSELQRELRTLRARVERAPRAARFELEGLQRRLRGQRTENPRDPKLAELALELAQLRAEADRAARRSTAPGLGPESSPRRGVAPIDPSAYWQGAAAPAGSPPARPYLGQRMVALQRSAAEIGRRLERGDTAAAARLLEAVKADMATLQAVFSNLVAEDPNMIALESGIRTFEHRLSGDRGPAATTK